MITAIADYIKARRHELGRHVLFVGHAVRTSPDELTVEELVQRVAIEWAEEHKIELPEEGRAEAALATMAEQVPSHLERCRRLRALTDERRPSEAHTRLARMIADGYFPAIFTTDPTNLLQRALRNQHMEPETDYHLVIAGVHTPEEISLAISGSMRVVIVKCAGSMTGEFLPLSQAEVDAAINDIAPVINSAFKPLSVLVGHTDRDEAFIPHVPLEGDRVFWVNRIIPMDDEDLFQELKMESPASVDYHRLQPHVTKMLAARSSSRHLLCRDPGEPNAFFSALEDRISRYTRSRHVEKKSGPSLSVLSGGPFRFLDYYRVEDAELFFGREQETDDVIEMIRNNKLSVLFGALGRGKTSLLLAGVTARMRSEAEESDQDHGTPWLPIYVRCGDDPIESTRTAVDDSLADEEIPRIELDRPLPDLLAEAIAVTGRPIVLLIDQFEEYFVKTGDRLQQEFAAQLAEALEQSEDKLRVLITIREDFLGHLYEMREQFPEILHHVYRLGKMSERAAKIAAIKPGSSFRLTIEEDLVDRVLGDLCHDGGCEPTELQIVMDRLYQTVAGHRHTIGSHTYTQLEGAERILRDYLEHTLQQLPPWERRLVRSILKQLVQSSELKAVRSVERIATEINQPEETVERILARLEDLRLVRRVGKPEKRQYEVVHEYMARRIEEWMTERQIEVKDIQDLLTRELGNYQKFGLLMQEGALRVLSTHRAELTISPEEMDLIVRSAVARQVDVGYWLGRVEELGELLAPTLKDMLHDKSSHVRQSALRALGPHVSRDFLSDLVELLDDEVEDVRSLAEEYLRGLDRDLVHLLARSSHEERHLAAYALGRIESRRALRPLAQALRDDDPEMRDEVSEALMEMDPEPTTRLLIRRLRESPDAPWAVAYALGRVAQEPRAIREIELARKNQPRSPQIAYALAMANAQRREFEAALTLLDEAERLVTTDLGRQNVQEMRQEVIEQQERASHFVEWLTFHGNARRAGYSSQQVTPPLKVRWRFQTRGPVVAGPCIGRGIVCFGSRDDYVYALDSSSGQLRWETKTNDRVESTPAIAGNGVYASSRDGHVYCFGTEDGNVRWSYDTGAATRSSPAVVGGAVFVGNQEGRLVAIEARTGRLQWQARAEDEISGAPTISGDHVVVASWDGQLRAFARADGSPAWSYDAGNPIAAAAAAGDGAIFFGSDGRAITALNATDGTELWRTEVDGRVRCCPALTEKCAVVGCMDGKIYAFDRADGSLLWAFQTDDEILASPAIASSIVYAGSKDGSLYALSVESGEELWRYSTSYAIFSSPATAEQMVVLGMQYYDVVAFVGQEFKPGALT